MLDINFIKDNKEKVAEAAKNKNRKVDLDQILMLDDKRRELIQKSQKFREERNQIASSNSDDQIRKRGKEIKMEVRSIDEELREVEMKLQDLLLTVPNVPLDEVPIGKDESANVEIKKWREPTKFNFKPKSHIELGENLDLIDLERGSAVSGFRGYFLKNQLAQIHFALLFYVFQKLVAKRYIPVIAPAVVKEFTLFGSAHFPWGRKEDVYPVGDDTYLSGTAEIPIMGYSADRIFTVRDLPKKYVAMSPCFRREAGSYGKDTKGIYRVHEFYKIEQVILAKNDLNEARELHKEMQENSEEILQELELPYRVMLMSTGDMGEPQMLKYDTETWMPSREGYGETMSNSIMGDFQCRRLNIRYKDADNNKAYCYSLNNTALASPRILIALLENHQQEDGSITIPKVLRSLVGFDKIEGTKSST